jgi:ATP-dependent Clp protease ATP-binding subunit ClpB
VDLELAKVMRLLAERNLRIELTPAARERIVSEGYDPAYGARPLRRTVQRLVQDPLAMRILDGSVLPGDVVRVDADPDSEAMRFERLDPKAAQASEAQAAAGGSASSGEKPKSRR